MSVVTPTNPPDASVTALQEARVEVRHQQTATTSITLGNALELVAGISEQLLGGEVANSFSGSPMSRGVIDQLALSSFQKNLAIQMGS